MHPPLFRSFDPGAGHLHGGYTGQTGDLGPHGIAFSQGVLNLECISTVKEARYRKVTASSAEPEVHTVASSVPSGFHVEFSVP